MPTVWVGGGGGGGVTGISRSMISLFGMFSGKRVLVGQ